MSFASIDVARTTVIYNYIYTVLMPKKSLKFKICLDSLKMATEKKHFQCLRHTRSWHFIRGLTLKLCLTATKLHWTSQGVMATKYWSSCPQSCRARSCKELRLFSEVLKTVKKTQLHLMLIILIDKMTHMLSCSVSTMS